VPSPSAASDTHVSHTTWDSISVSVDLVSPISRDQALFLPKVDNRVPPTQHGNLRMARNLCALPERRFRHTRLPHHLGGAISNKIQFKFNRHDLTGGRGLCEG